MKGFALKLLALAIMLALCIIPVSATDGDASELAEEETVSVGVSWEAAVFQYSVIMGWDYEKCESYENGSEWSTDTMGIVVTNESSCAVNVALSFASAEKSEKILETITGVFKLDGETVETISLDAPAEGSTTEKTVNFSVTGGKIASEDANLFSIGSITITINAAA